LDHRNAPKLVVSFKKGNRCVSTCPKGYVDRENFCFKQGDEPKSQDGMSVQDAFKMAWMNILIVCFVAFIFSYVCLVLYRYFAKQVIWVINIGFIIFVFVVGTFMFKRNLKAALMFYFSGVVLILALVLFRKKIALVAGIFKESSKSLMDVPAIMFEPILVSDELTF
jgi:hypothetical protein